MLLFTYIIITKKIMRKIYEAKNFNLPTLTGLSEKQVEVHLGLYKGYVAHVNKLQDELERLQKDPEANAYSIESVRRRLGFEFNGMRMHELYFDQMEEGPTDEARGGALDEIVSSKFGSFDEFLKEFKSTAMTRGIGWTVLAIDRQVEVPEVPEAFVIWVADHELGQLGDLNVLLALDMWEHAYMVDYTPAEKADYIEAFFKNLNWELVEKRI